MLTKMRARAILFDLDGTLIDQFEAIHNSFSRTMVSMGFTAPTFEKVKQSVGGGVDMTMKNLIGTERLDEAVSILRPIFEKEMLNGLKPLPGVTDGLKILQEEGFRCAVLTNKHGPHARAACKHLGLDKFLEFIIGANDTAWKKPHPELAQFALDQIGFSSSQSIYVGDSPYDYQTAQNGGMTCRLLTTGTHSFEELSKLQPQGIHADFKSLVYSLLQSN